MELHAYILENILMPAKKKSTQMLSVYLSKYRRRFSKMERIHESIENEHNICDWLSYIFRKNVNKVCETNHNFVNQVLEKETGSFPCSSKIEIYLESEHVKTVYASLQNFINISSNLKDLINEGEDSLNEYSNDNNRISGENLPSEDFFMMNSKDTYII